jgi:hypothetical protein
LLNLSDCRITLGKSFVYLRVALLIYSSSLIVLGYSACFLAGKIIIGALLLFQLLRIINNPRPNPNYSMLSYNKAGWLLHDNQDQQSPYDKLRVVINTGIFVLLELSTKKRILSQSPGKVAFLKLLSAMDGRHRAAWMRIACFKKVTLPGDCDNIPKKQRKLIVIFSDQLPENAYRTLNILEKINK